MTAAEVIQSEQAEKIDPVTERRSWLAQLSDAFLTCRLFRHRWEPEGFGYHDSVVNGRKVKALTLACDRCGAEKADRIVVTRRTIDRDSAYIAYPEGYEAPPGLNIAQGDLRREWLRRARGPRGRRGAAIRSVG